MTLIAELTPLVLGAVFVWWGGGGLLSNMEPRRVAATTLNHLIRDVRLTTLTMRTAAIATWTVGVGLLFAPTAEQSAVGSALIGIGLLGYAGYAMVTELEPAAWRTFVRAGLVGVSGLIATEADQPWWNAIADQPLAAATTLGLATAVVIALSRYSRRQQHVPISLVRSQPVAGVRDDQFHKLAC